MWHHIGPFSRWSSSNEVHNSLRGEKLCSTVSQACPQQDAKMLLPSLCWQIWQARPELLLHCSSAGLAVRSWCLPSLCHPGSKASPQELEAAQQAQAGASDDACVYIHFPQITHANRQFYTRPQLPCRQLCPEQNAGISSAKMQFSWKTATQNNCSRKHLVLRHWSYRGNRTSFNPLPRIIPFLELIPFSHSLLQ